MIFQDTLSSLKLHFKERITNPLIGTIITVWIFHNWYLVYAIFSFDKDYTLHDKIMYFKIYWRDHDFCTNLGQVVFASFTALIIYYILSALATLLKNLYSRNLLPWINKLWKGKYRTIEDYENLSTDRDRYQAMYESERTERVNIAGERDRYEKEKNENMSENAKNFSLLEKANRELGSVQKLAEQLKIDKENLTDNVQSLNTAINRAEKRNKQLLKNANSLFRFKIDNNYSITNNYDDKKFKKEIEYIEKNVDVLGLEIVMEQILNQSFSLNNSNEEKEYFNILKDNEVIRAAGDFVMFTPYGKLFYNYLKDYTQKNYPEIEEIA